MKIPPPSMTPEEVSAAYAAGERNFVRERFWMKDLTNANLADADLDSADFSDASLCGATLTRASLKSAKFILTGLVKADLSGANLGGAHFWFATLDGANFEGATMEETHLVNVDLGPFCRVRSSLIHRGPSVVDQRSIAKSLAAPGLAEFLVDTGMPHVYATYAIDSLRSLSETDLFQMLHSTFISYGGPDETFARRLHDALAANGVRTWFFPEHAVPGERLHRTMRDGVQKHDRMLLLCSRASLDRRGVLNEIEEVLDREASEGGVTRLIPVLLDDYALTEWNPQEHTGLAKTLRARVCADFRDPQLFDKQLVRLIDALKKVRPEPEEASA